MKPYLDVFGLHARSYGLAYFASFPLFVAIVAVLLRWRRTQAAAAIDLGLLMGVGYTVGARLLAAIVGADWALFTHFAPARVEGALWGGQAAFGALALVYLAVSRTPLSTVGDALAVGWAGATVLHKLGCFLAGCCDGAPSSLPWAVVFPADGQARNPGVPVHPTQLYDAAAALIAAAALVAAFAGRRGRSRLLLWWGMVFAASRFATEWTRSDVRFAVYGPVSAAMIAESAVFVACAALLIERSGWDRLVARGDRRASERGCARAVAARGRVFVAALGDAVVAGGLTLLVLASTRSVGAAVAMWFAYHVVSNALVGTGLVGRMLGLRSVDSDGASPDLAVRVARGLADGLTPVGVIGLLRPCLDGYSRTVGDALTRTFQVRDART